MKDFINNFYTIFDERPLEEITNNTKFKELPEWDSMAALSLVIMASDLYSKEISGDDILKLETIDDLHKFLMKND
jgi:acyl carrier protein